MEVELYLSDVTCMHLKGLSATPAPHSPALSSTTSCKTEQTLSLLSPQNSNMSFPWLDPETLKLFAQDL